METRLLRGIMFFLLAAIPFVACAEAPRDFDPSPSGTGGTGEQTSSSTSGMGGKPGAGGGGMGGEPGTGGGIGGRPEMGGSGGTSETGGAGGVGGNGGAGGIGGNGGTGGTGGQGGPCIWIDITVNDCSSGIKIADFCPAGRHVRDLERCDGTFYTPDANYQMYQLSGCPGVCPIVMDHVAWRKIECCL